MTLMPGRLLDLRDGEALVNRTVPLPENDPSVSQLFGGVSAKRLIRVPHRHPIERDTHLVSGVASEMLIGKEQHPFASLERPAQDPLGVR